MSKNTANVIQDSGNSAGLFLDSSQLEIDWPTDATNNDNAIFDDPIDLEILSDSDEIPEPDSDYFVSNDDILIDGTTVFNYELPTDSDTISGFLNVGYLSDQINLSNLLDNIGAPHDFVQRSQMVHLERQGDAVDLTVDGVPEFHITFVSPASSNLADFSLGNNIVLL